MYDIVIVAEKSRYVKSDIVLEFMDRFTTKLSDIAFSRLGLVVYCKYAFPLMDLDYNFKNLAESYRIIPTLKGTPEPSLGLYEAWEMIHDLDDGLADRKKIVLIASFAVKPRKPLLDAIKYVKNDDMELHILSTNTRKPHWLPKDIIEDIILLKQSGIDKAITSILS
ncbi:MAG: hypothetical protein DRO40_08790 [Thermoprotei archaeon]|nr:MAG: hypothetical protein DRO40_08790 [Thermoprotei archaeon]